MSTDPEPDHVTNHIQGATSTATSPRPDRSTPCTCTPTRSPSSSGPVDARGATFGADHDPTGHDDTEPA